ncbi:MAG: NAD-dependent epimerase/dehydratase family protein [Planctomycetota bacterium]|nr:NAD-dependent epimerase/dehydratase family protein [Planctomycetota bacterium]
MHASQQAARPRLIVGCGYLGRRVAARWLAGGERVVGTTRSAVRAAELAASGVEPVVIDVTAPDWAAVLARVGHPQSILWSVGFDRTAGISSRDIHVAGLEKLLDALASTGSTPPARVIFSSSTGVWGDQAGGLVDESTPPMPSREAGRVLVEAEALLAAHPACRGTALRFAGLYGPNRLPRLADLQAGRPLAADPDSWLNLIHIDDAAAVVEAVAEAAEPRPLYVVADGRPIRRRDWYTRLAELSHSPPPTWAADAPRARGGDKRVDAAVVWADLGRAPRYPDALAALPSLLRAG